MASFVGSGLKLWNARSGELVDWVLKDKEIHYAAFDKQEELIALAFSDHTIAIYKACDLFSSFCSSEPAK